MAFTLWSALYLGPSSLLSLPSWFFLSLGSQGDRGNVIPFKRSCACLHSQVSMLRGGAGKGGTDGGMGGDGTQDPLMCLGFQTCENFRRCFQYFLYQVPSVSWAGHRPGRLPWLLLR